MKNILFAISIFSSQYLAAQTDTSRALVHKDPRVDLLIKKQIQINEVTTRDSRRNIQGYRIQVISSADRNKVFSTKAKIYQEYPELKPYILYIPPNYKLRVGNFKTAEEAKPYLDKVIRLYPTGVYIVRDMIEVKPEKSLEN